MQDTERKINSHKLLLNSYNRKNNTDIKYQINEHIDLYQLNNKEPDFNFGHEFGRADYFRKYPYRKYLIYSNLLIPFCFLNKKTIIFAPLIFGINVLNNYVREFYADLFSVQFFNEYASAKQIHIP